MLIYDFINAKYFDVVGRVVFGEARGEPMEAKLGVAYTIINRIRHEAYPSNLYSVIFERMSNGNYQYETLNSPNDTIEWQEAKIQKDPEYSDVFQATVDALCRWKNDPTECATNFCSVDPCPATDSNPWWLAVKKRKLGGLYFVCRVSATAQSDRRSRGRDWK
uniref:Spore cortex-lytic enzyme n=1 Tax=Magallana gigas TaxID=29159 RepID=K1R9C3_MAGGI